METNWYNLSRKWFDFCFENPEIINTNHTALYMFIIDRWNRFWQKEKFWLPADFTMEALQIKSRNTYYKIFNDLVEMWFIEIIEKSKNQNTANIIKLACIKNNPADVPALDTANMQATTPADVPAEEHNKTNKQTNKKTNKQTISKELQQSWIAIENISNNKIIKDISLEKIQEFKNNNVIEKLFKIIMLDNVKQSFDIKSFISLYESIIEKAKENKLITYIWNNPNPNRDWLMELLYDLNNRILEKNIHINDIIKVFNWFVKNRKSFNNKK